MSLLGIARPRGQHRAIDRVAQLERDLAQAAATEADLRYRLAIATAGWDNANAKVSQLRDELSRAAEATRQNTTAVSSLTAHPAVAETQPIRVVTLRQAFAVRPGSTSPTHVPGI